VLLLVLPLLLLLLLLLPQPAAITASAATIMATIAARLGFLLISPLPPVLGLKSKVR
jgi:hypothetical protein